MRKFPLIILGIIALNFINAQALIDGIVLDENTKEPIPFVSVLLNNTFKGTTTDENGEFSLEIPDYSSNNSFSFQRVGYMSKTIGMVDFMRSNEILLSLDEQKVGEVIITPVDAFELVRKAVEKIPDNYYSSPIGQELFYRQVFLTDDELTGIEESNYQLINTFDRPKLPRSVTVKKARGYLNMDKFRTLGKLVAKNIEDDSIFVEQSAENFLVFNPNLEALTEDAKGIFGEKADKNYVFDYVGMVIKNGHVMHHIVFDQKEGLKKTLFTGSMYIDTLSYAIVEVAAKLSPQGIDFQKLIPLKFRLLAKLGGYTIGIQNVSFKASYEEYNDYWVVNEGAFTLKGSIKKRKQAAINASVATNYTVINNFAKTDFYSRSSEYDVIPSTLEPYKETYFWGNTPRPYLSPHVENKLQKLLKDL